MVEVKILGSLEIVVQGNSITPTAPKLRQILALLAIHSNSVVTITDFVDEIWGGTPPRSLSTTLQTYILQIRKLLRATGNREAGENELSSSIITHPGGYLLQTPKSTRKDFEDFNESVGKGHQKMLSGRYGEAVDLLTDALALWRGSALVDVHRGSLLDSYAVKLEEARLVAQILRVDACLGQGCDLQLLPELNSLAGLHPLNEKLQYQRMLALYRSGQIAESLQSYRNFYAAMMEQVGIEPSPQLRELQEAILNSLSALSRPSSSEETHKVISGLLRRSP
ncbi:AfsR/SARP family transcriptional regulator [Streptomyces sp. NA02950]|uniref:AfsR/SARP family transcriptional regulator n=1 Tax=Streptomyces sp. NA02950 TaxID=2742137 RepID=UPI0015916C0C|nr:AfsR/SARP family transcriptional regulator [Streptomyces sp. NA02950]QKV93074.1 AfsR/SARP family transcriptional regulator [Streptomyces sp. NA02950]